MRNKEEQYNKIMSVAKVLFYDQGYKDTFLDQIAKECGITKPLISYYFSSKAALAASIAAEYANDIKNTIAFKIYRHYYHQQRYDLRISTAIEIRMTRCLDLQDDAVYRFNYERFNDKFMEIQNSPPSSVAKYRMHNRRYHLGLSENELQMIPLVASPGQFQIVKAYRQGILDCSEEECLDSCVSLSFRMMHVPDDTISYILKQSKDVIDEIGFELKPYFKVV